ncbi:MAG: GNAT family N-acetyltransferase [Lachnospiraceae bacterium]|nr:GNAT family N-acetyltransferase [Lachnospiraceae bacterium]MDD7378519.1 GNAT family N-acetyltransferase [Lachnospiraceae bacterium]MDY4616277.1 GNAT family N-acetyltransferase [Lachnospiraceae bacterium]
MRIEERKILLKNGEMAILRSPQKEDAQQMIDYMRATSGETDYMVRYPEEISMTIEEEQELIERVEESEDEVFTGLFVGDKMIGNANIHMILNRIRTRHRASFGISIRQEYWGMGLGSVLLEKCLECAKQIGYEQVELEVVSTNERGIHLYEKYGFENCGTVKHAQRMKDGTYQDEYLMICFLQQ